MTTLSFKIACEVFRHSVEIDNWRMIQQCAYHYGQANQYTLGTRIILPDKMIEVMGYTSEMIRKALYYNQDLDRAIFSDNHPLWPGWCDRCGGLGTIDWITSVMKPKRMHNANVARHFKRDKERVLFYDGKTNGGLNCEFIFAPALIENERAAHKCKICSGTGLRLDGRLTLFQGLIAMKHRMKEFTWDGLNTPTASGFFKSKAGRS